MLKEHPKGLLVAFFTNMGERFGFYTMMAILVLFLQAKYGLSEESAGAVYSTFYFGIYGMALLGGMLADYFKKLRTTILLGQIIMFLGYILMATPGFGVTISYIALAIIAFGNGLFKGNLQALVGNLYEDPKYAHLRDRAFSIFYMGINIGAFFAPSAATGVRDWWLKSHGYQYDANLPQMCHAYIDGKSVDVDKFQNLADTVSGSHVSDLHTFAQQYIDIFSQGFHWAFGVAAVAMLVSLAIYLIFNKPLRDGDLLQKKKEELPESMQDMDPSEVKERLIALGLVFITVIFFWMAFHQNGLTLTFFARDYTVKEVPKWSYLFFDLRSFIPFIVGLIGLVYALKKGSIKVRTSAAIVSLIGFVMTYYVVSGFNDTMPIAPEKFQHFNPILIVFLTPVVVWFFGWLDKRGIEPSTPKKIAIGMFVAALAYVILAMGSFGLPAPHEIGENGSPERVSEYWLISTYFTLTIAELFLSPMGISFVAKVAPPKLKGSMQGAWLGATAVGNLLLQVGSYFWTRLEVWQVWAIFIGVTVLAGLFIMSIMRRLEKVAK